MEDQQVARDKQLLEEKLKRKKEKQAQIQEDMELTMRLKQQQKEEVENTMQKKVQEKEKFKETLLENQRHKQKALEDLERQKLEDIRAQEAYAKMLAKQEEDRQREIRAREERQQAFMAHMADTVIKEADTKAQEEEIKIKQYETQRNLKLKEEEDRKAKRINDHTKACRDFLFKQIEEKRIAERKEKEELNE